MNRRDFIQISSLASLSVLLPTNALARLGTNYKQELIVSAGRQMVAGTAGSFATPIGPVCPNGELHTAVIHYNSALRTFAVLVPDAKRYAARERPPRRSWCAHGTQGGMLAPLQEFPDVDPGDVLWFAFNHMDHLVCRSGANPVNYGDSHLHQQLSMTKEDRVVWVKLNPAIHELLNDIWVGTV